MDTTLRLLLAALLDGIDTAVQGVRDGALTADRFQAEMARRLFEGHVAAYLAGRGVDELSPQAERMVKQAVIEQLEYLNVFADKIADEGWRDAFAARAQLYAGSVKLTYSKAQTWGLDLPYHPTQTACMTNCGCWWDIRWIDQEELSADCTWKRGKNDSCKTCIDRANRPPIRFRGGERV